MMVTRPQSQADCLLQELRALGCEVTHFPVLSIEPLSESVDALAVQRIREYVNRLDAYDHAIFISTNAVHNAFKWINARWDELPAGIQWHAIGDATAKALKGHGVAIDESGDESGRESRDGLRNDSPAKVGVTGSMQGTMNSEALLAQPGLASLNEKRIIIFRGVGGRDYLADKLRERGAQIDYCELYRRQAQQHAPGELRQQLSCKPHLIMAASVETLTRLLNMAQSDDVLAALKERVLLVPGERVARSAEEMGFKHIIKAKNASLQAMLLATTSWYQTRD